VIPAAQAAPITHDSVAGFSTLAFSSQSVAAARRDPASMFDGSERTMRSLGVGGSLVAGIGSDRAISEISLVELTNGIFSNHREAVGVALGVDANGDGLADAGWLDIGVLRNDEWRSPNLPAVTPNLAQSVATLTGVFDRDFTRYTISVTGGSYNLVRFLDMSPSLAGRDGFDMAEFRLISNASPDFVAAIPEPMGVALLGAGLLGLGLARRHKAG
jgi:hypothetical protein